MPATHMSPVASSSQRHSRVLGKMLAWGWANSKTAAGNPRPQCPEAGDCQGPGQPGPGVVPELLTRVRGPQAPAGGGSGRSAVPSGREGGGGAVHGLRPGFCLLPEGAEGGSQEMAPVPWPARVSMARCCHVPIIPPSLSLWLFQLQNMLSGGPGWVGWWAGAPPRKPRIHGFDSQLEHMLGLRVRSRVGVPAGGSRSCSSCMSMLLSLPPFPSL